MNVKNFAGYQFCDLTDLKQLRGELLSVCKSEDLRGTILLSCEGINMFLAGAEGGLDRLLARIRKIPGLEEFEGKESISAEQPFRRMLVRIKKEIIAFGVEGVKPGIRTSPKLSARELKQWLDEDRDLVLLDTRNDYEVRLGTFKGALIPEIDTFRQFPDAVRKLPEDLKKKTVVMFCTGGIRCEKAGPFMEMEGYENVYQLDGGILKYFEECGGSHYDGECFVFDQRVGVDPALSETETGVCYKCQAPVSEEEREDIRYQEGVSCPRCFVTEKSRMTKRLLAAQAKLEAVCEVLPGSIAMENRRPIHISAKYDRAPLLEVLVDLFPHVSRSEWIKRCSAGRFSSYGDQKREAEYIVRAGERILQRFPAAIEPEVSTKIRILWEDEAIVVLEKPAPLPMHPCGRYHRNTLQYLLNQVYTPKYLRPVHRLDANTSGILLFARTRHFCRILQKEFLDGRVEKIYRARVMGMPEWNTRTCADPISKEVKGPGGRGVGIDGKAAKTHFRVLRRNDDNTTSIECRLDTGRTNQIRIHLWNMGLPIVGDPCYLPEGKMGDRQTILPDEPRMELQAESLGFMHPLREEFLRFRLGQSAAVHV